MHRLLLTVLPLTLFAQDPLDIIRKSVAQDQYNWLKAKDYTFVTRRTVRERDSKGNEKKVRRETREVLFLYGEPYSRLVEKDGKPLSPDQERKEQRDLEKFAAKRQSESEQERRKRLEQLEKEREKQRQFTREIPEAYEFRLLGEQDVNGRMTWVIEAEPRAGFRPKAPRAGILKKFRGKIWIDQAEYHWVRLEAEAVDTVSWGLLLARLAKGSTVFVEQAQINGEVWAPKRIQIRFDARLALLKRMLADVDVEFDEFRKFQAESRIVN